jgi:hypothetical protein
MQMAKIATWSDFEAASADLRRKWARDWLDRCANNYRRLRQQDAEADQRAFGRGHGDLDPMTVRAIQGRTSRTPNE